MPKVYRVKRPSPFEALARAEKLDARARDPSDCDDPAWLGRRAKHLRWFAFRRTKAHVRRVEERRKNS